MKSSSIGKAFGRVNLLGEHLDYNGGCVLPLQIDKSVTIKIEHKSDIAVSYTHLTLPTKA